MLGGTIMTIKEASQLTGVSADTLRYYERIGLIPAVPRSESGIRNYDETSIGWINFIKCAMKSRILIGTSNKKNNFRKSS